MPEVFDSLDTASFAKNRGVRWGLIAFLLVTTSTILAQDEGSQGYKFSPDEQKWWDAIRTGGSTDCGGKVVNPAFLSALLSDPNLMATQIFTDG